MILRIVAVYLLIGGLFQVGVQLYVRWRFGVRGSDAAIKVIHGGPIPIRWQMANAIAWPFAAATFFVPAKLLAKRMGDPTVAARAVKAQREAEGRCVDCGERHSDEEPPS